MEAIPPTEELPVESHTGDTTAPPSPDHPYRALAGAVRAHEAVCSHPAVPKRPADHALYAALRNIETAY